MKKLILTSLAAVAVMSAASFATLTPEKEVSQLTLDNVLGLTDGETPSGWEEKESVTHSYREYDNYVRHFTYHTITCTEGGPNTSCTPNSWVSFYDSKK